MGIIRSLLFQRTSARRLSSRHSALSSFCVHHSALKTQHNPSNASWTLSVNDSRSCLSIQMTSWWAALLPMITYCTYEQFSSAWLISHGLVINVTKCQLVGTPIIDYIGHHITREGAIPLPAKVDAIRRFERPITVKGLQRFTVMVNFYHRFVPNAARIIHHIYAALADNPVNLEWSNDLEDAFNGAKEALAQATMRVHPHAGCPLH